MKDKNSKRNKDIPRTSEIERVRSRELEMWEKIVLAIILFLVLLFYPLFYDGTVPII